MRHFFRTLSVALFALVLAQVAYAQSDEKAAVAAVLDDFHNAASEADGDRYFGHFAENAVFLGTDITERWALDEFRAYGQARFDEGTGWTYTPQSRQVYVSGDTAWFDEILHNERYGMCRGGGVLLRVGDTWKIAQYNLTVPIPNGLLDQVVDLIQEEAEH